MTERAFISQDNENPHITSSTMATSVYLQIRSDILNHTLRPGEKLRAEYLRDRYHAGNSPIREALNRLSVDGFVTREEQRGFRVATVSKDELRELIDTRCWMEEIALRKSIENTHTEWEENLVLAYHRLSRVPRSAKEGTFERNPEWDDLHHGFHMALISACGSRWLIGFCKQLNDQADRYRCLSSISQPNRNTMDEHRSIMEASINGDADTAVAELHNHFRRTEDIILQSDFDFVAD